MMRVPRKIIIAAGAGLALLAGGTAAGAAIAGPISGGVIYGCYATNTAHGSHRIVLQDAGTACRKNTTPISWNQQGPAGPAGAAGPSTAGPGGLDTVIVSVTALPVNNYSAFAACPADHPYLVGGGASGDVVSYPATDSQGTPITGEETPGNTYGWYAAPTKGLPTAYAICAK